MAGPFRDPEHINNMLKKDPKLGLGDSPELDINECYWFSILARVEECPALARNVNLNSMLRRVESELGYRYAARVASRFSCLRGDAGALFLRTVQQAKMGVKFMKEFDRHSAIYRTCKC
jgi:hypothetical protein